jgi:spermidine synthase
MNKFYLLTSFICGAIVMIIEIVGTKILSPFFGSGLFVWSSTITVAMLALSVGYFIGGKNADKIENLNDHLYMIVFIIGVILLLTYDFSKVIYFFYDSLDIKISTFLSAFILLFAPLTLLGMVSPIILKLTTKEFNQIGKDLGFISSISTMGSLVGSLLAGFILLSYFGTKEIFFYCAIALMLLSSVYFIKNKNFIYVSIMVTLAIFAHKTSEDIIEVKNSNIVKVDKKEGFYGTVSVVDIVKLDDPKNDSRLMLLDGMPQGQVHKKTNKSLLHYPYLIEEIIAQLDADKRYKDILFIGVGAGSMPSYLGNKYNVKLVDINPVVVDFAKKYFNLKEEVIIQDARVFVNKLEQKQDIIIIDAFSGETLPTHLLSKEFMAMMKKRLTPDGLVMFNIIGNPYNGLASKSIVKTIASEFSSVSILPLKQKNVNVINYVLVATNRDISINKKDLLDKIYPRVNFSDYVATHFTDEKLDLITNMKLYKDGEIITDNFNRVDFLSLDERKEVRKALINFAIATN